MANFQVNAGHISRPRVVGAGQIVNVRPAAGATAIVEYTIGTDADVANNAAIWRPWPKGTVTAAASDQLNNAGFIRVTALGGNVSYEVDDLPSKANVGAYRTDWQSSVGASGAPALSGQPVVGGVITATMPPGVLATLQFTKTLKASPFTKSNIAGAVANAVNALSYTVLQADMPYIIGCDASAQVSAAAGLEISVPTTGNPAYQRFRNSLLAVAAGTGYSRVGLLGDSTTAGARALGPAANAVRTESPVVYLKTRLNLVQSLPTIASSWIGDQSFGMTNTLSPYAYDTRLSQPDGAGFTYTSPTRTVAGSLLFNSTNAFRLGFLPEEAVDTFDIYYAINTTLGTFDVTRTGSTLVNVNQAGTSGIGKYILSGTLSSSNPLYAARNTGGAYIIGTDAYNSTVKTIRLFGLGWSGGKVADWIVSTQGFDPLPAAVALGLDLVLIRPGINDAVAGTAPATFKTQLATLVDTLIAAGTNVALATHYPSNVASAAQVTQDAIAQQVRDVASERGLSVRDTYAEWGTWVASNALGYMADNLHPNKAGYEAEAVWSATFLLGLAA